MSCVARRCPTCARAVPGQPGEGAWPFCSDRCKLVDLGRWMGEEYRIPGSPAGDGAARPGDEDEEGA